MNFLILGWSVGKEKSGTRRPSTSVLYLWSLGTTRQGYKLNEHGDNGGREERKINVVIKVKRKQRKKDKPP